MLKRNTNISVVSTISVIENNAGGKMLYFSNLRALSQLFDNIDLFFIDNSCSEIKFGNFISNRIHFKSTFILRFVNLLVKSLLIKKLLLYFYLWIYYPKIWVEHFYALPNFKITPKFIFNKIIYSQHDFLNIIKSYRDNRPKENLFKLEFNTISKCKLMISGNLYEVQMGKNVFNVNSYYLPMHCDPKIQIQWDYSNKIYHLGSINTTASRLGLNNFIYNVLPLCDFDLNLMLIGFGTDAYSGDKINALGFVDKLENVLLYGSINIIPWKFPTGQRTRVFEALSFGNVIISYDSLNAIIPELRNRENCILVSNDSEFSGAIYQLINDIGLRKRIATGALSLAKEFSLKNKVNNIDRILLEGFK